MAKPTQIVKYSKSLKLLTILHLAPDLAAIVRQDPELAIINDQIRIIFHVVEILITLIGAISEVVHAHRNLLPGQLTIALGRLVVKDLKDHGHTSVIATTRIIPLFSNRALVSIQRRG